MNFQIKVELGLETRSDDKLRYETNGTVEKLRRGLQFIAGGTNVLQRDILKCKVRQKELNAVSCYRGIDNGRVGVARV